MLNIRIILIVLFFNFIVCFASNGNTIQIERFVYHSHDSIPIEGTLYLPNGKVKSIIIQLYTTHVNYRHPDFKSLSDSIRFQSILPLISNGYGVALISPRYKQTKENLPKIKDQTYKTLADDGEALIKFLKSDSRFTSTPIGVWGFSATGIAAAKLASRKNLVDFAMLMSTPSTIGAEDLYFKWDTNMKESVKDFYMLFFREFERFFPKDHFIYNDSIYTNTDQSKFDQIFIECVWDCMKNINKSVLQNNEKIDTIHILAQNTLKSAFKTDTIKTKIFTPFMPSKDPMYINQFIYILINITMYSPLDIDYLKWNPEDYYPKICCPTLMLFAEKDVNIDMKGSIENSKRIVNTYKKTNFSIVVIPNVDHEFYEPLEKVSFEEKGRTYTLNKYSRSFLQSMLNWLESVQH
ncbi:MAG: hypothetical protein PHQ11_00930 [Paludibacter sp.]|nr:hypothetical protein [Paludibacter sp.]MDD4198401.1 hypothetical protein [Paludibacter sp.]MDD4427079.1 hypothetical protein [Paludibacter sp.]